VIADLELPVIGVDLLSHYGLLFYCRKNRPLDGVTSLSTPGLIAPQAVPSVKFVAGGTPPENYWRNSRDRRNHHGAVGRCGTTLHTT
jgi:hypothetical protein